MHVSPCRTSQHVRTLYTSSAPTLLCPKQRGGRHEGLLEMLNDNGFHVRALDPACADDLRAHVAGSGCDSNRDHDDGSRGEISSSISSISSSGSKCEGTTAADDGGVGGAAASHMATGAHSSPAGATTASATATGARAHSGRREWPGPEWTRGTGLPQERRKIRHIRPGVSKAGRGDSRASDVHAATDEPGIDLGNGCVRDEAGHGDGGQELKVPGGTRESVSEVGNGSLLATGKVVGEEQGGGGGWGYKEDGLGKILAFVARRRFDCNKS